MNEIGTTLQSLFNLDFSRTEIIVISLLPALVNLLFFGYILVALPKTRTNILFASFTFFVSMWQMADGFMRLAVDLSTAENWNYIMGIYSLMVTPMGIIFIVNFNRWQKSIPNGILMLSQFIPATFFICVNVGRVKTHEIVPSEYWYWIANPNQDIITKMIYAWVSIQGLIMLIMVWLNTFLVRKNKLKRQQSLLLSIGFSIPVIGGIASQSITPLLLKMDNFPITAPLFTFFSLFTFISVLKYDLLEFNPKHQWDKIIESMNEGLLIVNLNNEIMYANNLFCKITGYTSEELLFSKASGRFLNNIHPIDSEADLEPYELLITSKTGDKIWFLVNKTPYIDIRGVKTGYTILYTNINDSKRSEEKFKALVENAGDIISLIDHNANFMYASPAMQKVLGYSINDLKSLTVFDIIHPDYIEDSKKSIHLLLQNPGKLIPRTSRFITKSGKEIWLEGVLINLLNDENVQAIVTNHRDISERKINEVKIQKFIEVTTDQNQKLQNFAHIVSHNIRSHVVNISGIVDILSTSKEEKEKEQLMKMLKASTSKLSETTDNLNDIITIQNTIDRGWLELNLKNEIIKTHDSINAISDNCKTKIINLVKDDVNVNVIPSYLESILLNLMTNAIKYRSPFRDPEITLYTEDDEDHIILNVCDNGIGIDLNLHGTKLFGMYKTFHAHKDARGLGLFITKNQIEAMDGKIMVESEPEKGSNFKIFFKKKMSA